MNPDGLNKRTIREQMDYRARETPDHPFCRYGDRVWRFDEIDAAVNRLANALLALGLQPGDRVALMLPTHPDHIIAVLALAKTGLVRIPINTNLKGVALEFPFEQFEPAALIADHAYAPLLNPVLAERPPLILIWRGPPAPDGHDLAGLMAAADDTPPTLAPSPDDILAITPSSGTTGAPKGVLKSELNLRTGPVFTRKLADLGPGDVLLMWEPLHHGAGVNVVMTALFEPITLAIVERFSASRFWDQVRAYGVTRIHFLGSVLQVLLRQPARPEDRQHQVRIAWGGGCPADVWTAFEERFGVEIREGYGCRN